MQEPVRRETPIQLSHAVAADRQIVLLHSAVELRAFRIQPVEPLPRGHLPRTTYLGRQVEDQREVRLQPAGGGAGGVV